MKYRGPVTATQGARIRSRRTFELQGNASMKHYDLAVIGSGPAGHFGAIQAAKAGREVVVIEKDERAGGTSAITGTIPSKSLREATLHLTGMRQRAFYGSHYTVKQDLTIGDLQGSTAQIIASQTATAQSQLRRNDIRLIHGKGSFLSSHELVVEMAHGRELITAEVILIAVGSRPSRPPGLEFDGQRVCDSNQILLLQKTPRRLMVVGAGVIGIEYACIFSALGCQVTVVDQRNEILEFVDRQVLDVLRYHMQHNQVEFRLGEEVVDLQTDDDDVMAITRSNKHLRADCLLYTVGRQGNADRLCAEEAGLTVDDRGRISTNEFHQTCVPHIYAAGDVIGFPALASTSREQGRTAVCHGFGIDAGTEYPAQMPYGIYSIPEISMFGPTERELTEKAVPYEIGIARYREIARGQILGDTDGLLKILFHRETLKILAVHVVGEGATELIHIGQAVEALGGTLHYFAQAIFNYPTLAECYKVAALDGLNRVGKGGQVEKKQAMVTASG